MSTETIMDIPRPLSPVVMKVGANIAEDKKIAVTVRLKSKIPEEFFVKDEHGKGMNS